MPGVFVSYRREDTGGYAGALVRELNKRLGPEQVFMDIEDIDGGTEFPKVIKDAIGSCDVLLALIGSRWLSAKDTNGNRRLDDQYDFVRKEIALGLNQQKRVIPVLVEGTRMPGVEELPEELKPLVTRNAIELSNIRWDEDLGRLTDHIKEGLYAGGAGKEKGAQLAADFLALPPMTKTTLLFVILSLGLGIAFGSLGVFIGIKQVRFEKRSQKDNAQVVRVIKEDSDDGGYVYRPELQFSTENDQVILFKSSVASNPPDYKVGDRVRILYDPNRPESAVIDRFMDRWFMTTIFTGLAVPWLVIGIIILGIRGHRRVRLKWLLKNGWPITTSLHKVEVNTKVQTNGKHPWYLVSEWRHPVTKELVHFSSHHVWDDPTEKAKNRMITVVVDPDNFKRYAMDISFLREKHMPKPRTI